MSVMALRPEMGLAFRAISPDGYSDLSLVDSNIIMMIIARGVLAGCCLMLLTPAWAEGEKQR